MNVHDNVSLQQAVYLFGAAYVGIQVLANAESQFDFDSLLADLPKV